MQQAIAERVRADHVVQRVVIDVTCEAEDRAVAIQDRLSLHFHRRLQAVIDACLSEVATPEAVYDADQVVLDIGPIDEATMEEELTDAVREALRRWVRAQMVYREMMPHREMMSHADAPASSQASTLALPLALSLWKRLAVFLERGIFPWTAGQSARPDALLQTLIEQHAALVNERLRAVGQQTTVRQRMARQLAETTLQQVTRLLEPHHAAVILAYAADVQQVQERKPFVVESAATFRQVRWELILTYLLVERGSHFNTRSFFRSLLRQLAQRYRLDYADLLAGLLVRVHMLELPRSAPYAFPAMLLALHDEEQTGIRTPVAQPTAAFVAPDAAAHYADLDVLDHLLQHGVLPAWSTARSHAEIDPLVTVLLEQNPEALVVLVRRLGQREQVRARLLQHVAVPTLRRLVTVLEPTHAPTVVRYSETLRTHAREAVPEAIATEAWEKATWAFVLKYLLVERGSTFNTQMFVASVLRQMAAHLNTSYAAVLAFIRMRVRTTEGFPTHWQRLSLILERLHDEVDAPTPPVPDAPAEVAGVEAYLWYGAASEAGGREEMEQGQVGQKQVGQKQVEHWLRATDDARLVQLLRRIGPDEQVLTRLVTLLAPATWERILRLLAPSAHAALGTYERTLLEASTRHALVEASVADVAVALRRYLLAYLLRHEAPVRLEAAVEATLRALAARYGVAYTHMLAAWSTTVTTPTLTALCQTLQTRAYAAGANLRPDGAMGLADEDAEARWEQVLYYLRHGALPRQASDVSEGALRREADELIATRLRWFVEHERAALQRDPAFLQRLMRLVSPAARARLLAVLNDQAPAPYRPDSVEADATRADHTAAPLSATGQIAALVHVLVHGRVPWWGRELFVHSVDTWFGGLLRTHADALCDALRRLAMRHDAMQRLAELLRPSSRWMLVQALAPGNAAFVRRYLSAAENMEGYDAGYGEAALYRTHWAVVWELLLESPHAAFRAEVLVEHLMRRTARRHSLTPAAYLAAMQTAVEQHASANDPYGEVAAALKAVAKRLPEPVQLRILPNGQPSPPSPTPALSDVHTAPPQAADRQVDQQQTVRPDDLEMPGDVKVSAGLLAHVLRHAVLPETASLAALSALDRHVRASILQAPRPFRALFLELLREEVYRLRLVRLFSAELLDAVLALLIPRTAPLIAQDLAALDALLPAAMDDLDPRTLRTLTRTHLLRTVAEKPGHDFDRDSFLTSLLLAVAREGHRSYAELIDRLYMQRMTSETPHARRLAGFFRQSARSAVAEEVVGRRPGRAHPDAQDAQDAALPESAAVLLEEAVLEEAVLEEELLEGEPIYIFNAGLVILWPFLTRFFQTLDLVEGRAFRDAEAAYRGVRLLQGLAQGPEAAQQAPEYHLVLNKLLCGVEVARPLVQDVTLSSAAQELSRSLLYGVTQNWSKLNNTSPEGLQEMFLQRDGRLLFTDDRWDLTVDVKPYDMLLDFLPWSLNIIRLPWMKHPLHVTWR